MYPSSRSPTISGIDEHVLHALIKPEAMQTAQRACPKMHDACHDCFSVKMMIAKGPLICCLYTRCVSHLCMESMLLLSLTL